MFAALRLNECGFLIFLFLIILMEAHDMAGRSGSFPWAKSNVNLFIRKINFIYFSKEISSPS